MLNLATIEFFNSVFVRILTILFVILYYNINEYLDRNKVVRLFDKKFIQNMYCYTLS